MKGNFNNFLKDYNLNFPPLVLTHSAMCVLTSINSNVPIRNILNFNLM